jgi:hypothetical protein
MRFLRRRSTPGLVALLAVAMQAALFIAQAHVHPHAHGHRVRIADAAIACRAIVRTAQCDAPAVPHDHRQDCPLCCSLAAANGVLPEAPVAVIAVRRFEPPLPLASTPSLAAAAALSFQARAPPVA